MAIVKCDSSASAEIDELRRLWSSWTRECLVPKFIDSLFLVRDVNGGGAGSSASSPIVIISIIEALIDYLCNSPLTLLNPFIEHRNSNSKPSSASASAVASASPERQQSEALSLQCLRSIYNALVDGHDHKASSFAIRHLVKAAFTMSPDRISCCRALPWIDQHCHCSALQQLILLLLTRLCRRIPRSIFAIQEILDSIVNASESFTVIAELVFWRLASFQVPISDVSCNGHVLLSRQNFSRLLKVSQFLFAPSLLQLLPGLLSFVRDSLPDVLLVALMQKRAVRARQSGFDIAVISSYPFSSASEFFLHLLSRNNVSYRHVVESIISKNRALVHALASSWNEHLDVLDRNHVRIARQRLRLDMVPPSDDDDKLKQEQHLMQEDPKKKKKDSNGGGFGVFFAAALSSPQSLERLVDRFLNLRVCEQVSSAAIVSGDLPQFKCTSHSGSCPCSIASFFRQSFVSWPSLARFDRPHLHQMLLNLAVQAASSNALFHEAWFEYLFSALPSPSLLSVLERSSASSATPSWLSLSIQIARIAAVESKSRSALFLCLNKQQMHQTSELAIDVCSVLLREGMVLYCVPNDSEEWSTNYSICPIAVGNALLVLADTNVDSLASSIISLASSSSSSSPAYLGLLAPLALCVFASVSAASSSSSKHYTQMIVRALNDRLLRLDKHNGRVMSILKALCCSPKSNSLSIRFSNAEIILSVLLALVISFPDTISGDYNSAKHIDMRLQRLLDLGVFRFVDASSFIVDACVWLMDILSSNPETLSASVSCVQALARWHRDLFPRIQSKLLEKGEEKSAHIRAQLQIEKSQTLLQLLQSPDLSSIDFSRLPVYDRSCLTLLDTCSSTSRSRSAFLGILAEASSRGCRDFMIPFANDALQMLFDKLCESSASLWHAIDICLHCSCIDQAFRASAAVRLTKAFQSELMNDSIAFRLLDMSLLLLRLLPTSSPSSHALLCNLSSIIQKHVDIQAHAPLVLSTFRQLHEIASMPHLASSLLVQIKPVLARLNSADLPDSIVSELVSLLQCLCENQSTRVRSLAVLDRLLKESSSPINSHLLLRLSNRLSRIQ